jgi:hypothetical protein
VAVNLTPETEPWHPLNFVVAEVLKNVLMLDRTKATTIFTVEKFTDLQRIHFN